MRRLIAAGLTGFFFATLAFAATPEERYQAAMKTLTARCDAMCGFGLGEDAGEVKALDGLWDATEDWTLSFLDAHPAVSDKALAAELLRRHPGYRDDVAPNDVTRLGPELYGFTAQWAETGTVFLVGKKNGRWAVLWDIRKAETGKFPILQAWTAAHARQDCEPQDGQRSCGPLHGYVHALSPDPKGHIRFVIDAIYAQVAGATVAGQVSFWRWDGSTATPLAAGSFITMLDDHPVTVKPGAVSLRLKDSFKSFMSCGACVGRQLDWNFRVLPDRIVDEGQKPLVPEYDAVDEILSRFLHGKPAYDLASPKALKTLGAMFAYAEGESSDLGMEADRTIKQGKSSADVCLATDGFFATHFIVEKRKERFYIAEVRRTKSHSCK